MFAVVVVSCSDDSLPEKFAEAFQKGDTLTCYKLYPNSRTFISFIDSNKLKNLEGAEKKNYKELSKSANFSLNGVEWSIDTENHVIDGTDGLVNVERVISNRISNKFYQKYHNYFEQWSKETRDVHRAKHINKFLPEFDKFWKVLNAIKNRDGNIVRSEIPDIHYFINRKFSDDFENASLSKDSIYLAYFSDQKLAEIKYFEKSCYIQYYVGSGRFSTTNLFDKAEYEKEFAALPIKMKEGPGEYSDNTKIEFIKYVTEYIKVSQEYIEAVLAGNTDVANKLYPDGNFITSATIRKNIGKPISYDGVLSYSGGCVFVFNDPQNDAITIKYTCRLYDYSSYYSQYLSMDGAKKLDLSESNYDKWNYDKIRDAIRNLSRTKDSEDFANKPQRSQNVNTGGWEKGYVKDEFGNIDESRPYIYQIWPGRRNESFDCNLGIRITRDFIQFTITEDYQEPLLSGVKVTAQLNGEKFQINYDGVENESVYINNSAEVRKLLNALDTDGTLMLSFRRTDSFDKTHNYLFTIYGSTSVSGAIQKFLME